MGYSTVCLSESCLQQHSFPLNTGLVMIEHMNSFNNSDDKRVIEVSLFSVYFSSLLRNSGLAQSASLSNVYLF